MMGMRSTAAASALCIASFMVAIDAITGGFQHWTFESIRRELARTHGLQTVPLTLRDAQGHHWRAFEHPSSESDRAHAVHVVGFIYTRCPSICQVLGSEFFRMQDRLQGTAGEIRLLSVSIDPLHDDQPSLRAYAQQHRADSASWTVAAPSAPADLPPLLSRLGVVALPDGMGGFVHNGSIHVIDRTQRVRAIYDWKDWEQALATARGLAARPS